MFRSITARTLRHELAVEVKFDYDNVNRMIHVYPGEWLALPLVRNYFNAILDDDNIEPGFVEIVHFDSIKSFDLSSNDAIELKGLATRIVEKKQQRGVIIIATSILQFGMARMMLTIVEGDAIPTIIVRSEEEAMLEADKLRR